MKHNWLRILAALTCTALLMTGMPAIATEEAPAIEATVEVPAEVPSADPEPATEPPTAAPTDAPTDAPAESTEVPASQEPSAAPDPTESAAPTESAQAPATDPTGEPVATPEATASPAQSLADALGVSLEELAQMLGVQIGDLDSMTSEELQAALPATQALNSDFVIEAGRLVAYTGTNGDVAVPDGVTAIGDAAFKNCAALTSVSLPGSVTEIGRSAFEGCANLKRVSLPDGLRDIAPYAFKDCAALREIDLPDKLERIGEYAFQGCERLEKITLPKGIRQLGGVLDSDNQHIFLDCTGLKSATLSEGLTAVGKSMFAGCSALEELNLPSTLTIIDASALSGCASLKRLTLPADVTNIAASALTGCPNLEVRLPYGSAAEAACKAAEISYTYTDAISDVHFADASLTLGVGERFTPRVEWSPEGIDPGLKFSSSNSRYVTVTEDGVVQGKRTGSATITVKTYNGASDKIKVTVKKAPSSVSIKTTRTELGVGETAQLSATLSSGSAGGYSFSSADAAKLAVDENGLVTALAPGEVDVTATTYNGKKKSGTITVKPAPQSVTLDSAALTVGAEDSWKLGYSLSEGSTGAVSFASSDEAIATVDADGTIHALKQGAATITATTYNGKSAICALTVAPAPTGVTLAAARTIGVGEKLQLDAQIQPAGTVGTLKFSSSNKKYVTVTEDGVVQGKRTGSATITVKTYNGASDKIKVTVKKAPSSVSIKTTRTELGVGETAQLTATLSSGSAGGYSFSSGDTSKLAVDENGLATALAPGEVEVTATTYNGKRKSGTITVKPAPQSVTLDSAALTVGAEDSWKLGYSLSEGSAGAVYFASSDEAIATVDADGTIHALKQGAAAITATTYNGKSAICALTVAPAPTGVTLAAVRTIGVGEKLQLTAQIQPAGTVGTLKFSSSNKKYVTVTEDGIVQGKRVGSATITVKTYNGASDKIKVTVKKAPSSVSIKTTRTELGVGETAQLSATLSSGSAGGYSFSSGDTSKLSVDENGLATALAPGEVEVTVITYNGKKRSGTITVKPAPQSIALDSTTLTVGAEDSWKLGYSLSEGSTGAVSFASSDETIATVDASGTIHALKQGAATITATTYNGKSAACALTVAPAPTGVELAAVRTIGVGEKLQLNAQIQPAGTVGTLKFSSSNKRYVTVTADGVVQGKRAGSATVTVKTYNGASDKLKVTVKKAPSSVSIKTTRTELGVGETAQLTATLSSGSAGGYSFSSADESKLTVDANGLVTALAPGEVDVTATTYNGKRKSGTITVKPAPQSIALDSAALTVGADDSWKLGYSLSEGSTGAVSFASSDEAIATVDADGTIHALKQGAATITATTYNGKSAACALTVAPAPTGVELAAVRTIGVGEKLQLNAQIQPAGTVGTLKFSSSNKRYVTVTADGVVQGKRAGSATVTVKTYNGASDKLKVTVKKAPSSVSIKTTRTELGVGETAQLTATLSSGSAGGYSFSSADESKLTVDANGLVTALAPGEVDVTVTTYNGKKKSGTITVKPAPQAIALDSAALTVGAEDSWKLGYSLSEGSTGAVSFASSDEAIATVDADGTIHALKQGAATITATTYNGKSAACALTVAPAPSYVALPYETLNIGLGDEIQLEPEVDPGCFASFRYSSSNTKYAKVSAEGTVRGVKVGSATITIKTYNDRSFKLKVNVKKAPSALKLTPAEMKLGVGESAQLGYSITGNSATTLRYLSEDSQIAAISESGMVTGVAPGETTITATTHNGKSASCAVTVVPAPEAITVEAPTLLGVGQAVPLNVALLPEGSHTTLRYEIISGDAVSVDEGGLVTAELPGKAVVRASTHVEGLYADHEFLVKPAPKSISFDADSYAVNMGETLQLNPVLLPEDCHTELTYAIKRAGFFTIDEGGLVTPIMRGSTTVTVTTHNDLSATITVQVVDPYFPEDIAFAAAPISYLNLGTSYTPVIEVYPETAIPALMWSSSDPNIVSVNAETGEVTAISYGRVTITGVSARNPALSLSYNLIVLSPSRCLKMPARRSDTGSISSTLSQIKNVRASAYLELESLYATGVISSSDYKKRKTIVERAFDMYLFPWMTKTKELYWRAANSENGAKDYKPGIVYHGMAYTQSNRTYNVSKVLDAGLYSNSGKGYYLLNGDKFSSRNYPGNDCSSFVSMAIWGMGTSHSADSTRGIGSTSAYRTLTDSKDLRPGDILNKSGSHVVMFLYYANAEKTQMVIIEQGGGEFDTNTCSCSIRDISTYLGNGYKIRRLDSLG